MLNFANSYICIFDICIKNGEGRFQSLFVVAKWLPHFRHIIHSVVIETFKWNYSSLLKFVGTNQTISFYIWHQIQARHATQLLGEFANFTEFPTVNNRVTNLYSRACMCVSLFTDAVLSFRLKLISPTELPLMISGLPTIALYHISHAIQLSASDVNNCMWIRILVHLRLLQWIITFCLSLTNPFAHINCWSFSIGR